MSLPEVDRTFVVAGNGPSLGTPAPGRILSSDYIVRVNNFFAEPEYFLGRRVDLAFVAGDPRVSPFVFEGIRRAARHYRVLSWGAPHARQIRSGQRRLRLPRQEMRYANPQLAAQAREIADRHGLQPTSGVQAMFLAHAMGARRIVLTGVDLYQAGLRYTYEPGPRMHAALGADLGGRGYDARLHSAELDRRLIALLRDQPDLSLLRAGSSPALDDLLDLAPERAGASILREPKPPSERMADWPSRAGLYPLWLLLLLRRGRALQRRFLQNGAASP